MRFYVHFRAFPWFHIFSFQFSLWDSGLGGWAYPHDKTHFQFSLWDSWLWSSPLYESTRQFLSILFMRFSSLTCLGSNCSMLITFNSLYEILALWGLLWSGLGVSLSILFMRFSKYLQAYRRAGFRLSILFMRFLVWASPLSVSGGFQFSLWDSEGFSCSILVFVLVLHLNFMFFFGCVESAYEVWVCA